MYTIYKIMFTPDQVYVGQTQDFHRRRLSHLSNHGQGSPLLQAAFRKYGIPTFEVLEQCDAETVDQLEIDYITKLQPSLNTLPRGKSMRGLNHPRTQYTKNQILQVVDLFLNTTKRYREISEVTEVSEGTVHDVCKQRSHSWATENIDQELLQSARALRNPQKHIYSPSNEHYSADTVVELANQTGVPASTLTSVLNSKTGVSRCGWGVVPHPLLRLTDPHGESFELTRPQAQWLLEGDQLSKYQRNKILQGESSGGWCSETLT